MTEHTCLHNYCPACSAKVARLRELLQEARSAALAYTHLRVEELHDLAERINAALGGER